MDSTTSPIPIVETRTTMTKQCATNGKEEEKDEEKEEGVKGKGEGR